MLDTILAPRLAPSLNLLATQLEQRGISANHMTLLGLYLGIAAASALAWEQYALGLVLFLLNRICDGLDGSLARLSGITDWGGYLDIVSDFIVYAALVLGFALAQPKSAIWACLLLFGFMGTATTFLTFAIFAAKNKLESQQHGPKAFYYLGGLAEGSETILFFLLACLFPAFFPVLALVFSGMCFVTTLFRVLIAKGILNQSDCEEMLDA
jgi:phosphatidylglycerophosphate synthase